MRESVSRVPWYSASRLRRQLCCDEKKVGEGEGRSGGGGSRTKCRAKVKDAQVESGGSAPRP